MFAYKKNTVLKRLTQAKLLLKPYLTKDTPLHLTTYTNKDPILFLRHIMYFCVGQHWFFEKEGVGRIHWQMAGTFPWAFTPPWRYAVCLLIRIEFRESLKTLFWSSFVSGALGYRMVSLLLEETHGIFKSVSEINICNKSCLSFVTFSYCCCLFCEIVYV